VPSPKAAVPRREEELLKIIGIAGSPRREGNTDLLLGQVMAGAQSVGAQTKTIILCDLDIHPCRHCDGCLETGKCVIQDDMKWIYEDIRSADRLVIASPMFFMALSAQTKMMVDRCQCLWVMKYVLKLPVATNSSGERRGLFVATGGTQYPNLFQPSLVTIKSLFSVIEVKLTGEVTFRGIDEKGKIAEHPTALQDAFAAGIDLAADSEK
jgi:multimeric flavodoxin WrbA